MSDKLFDINKLLARKYYPFYYFRVSGIPLRTYPHLCLSLLDCLSDLVRELGELCDRIAAFPEVEIGPVIDRIDYDLFAAPAGEEEKGRTLPEVLTFFKI